MIHWQFSGQYIVQEKQCENTQWATHIYFTFNPVCLTASHIGSTEAPLPLLNPKPMMLKHESRVPLATTKQHAPKEMVFMNRSQSDSNLGVCLVSYYWERLFVLKKNLWEGFWWLKVLWVAAHNHHGYDVESGEFNPTIRSKYLSEVIFWWMTAYSVVARAVALAFLRILQGHAPKPWTVI